MQPPWAAPDERRTRATFHPRIAKAMPLCVCCIGATGPVHPWGQAQNVPSSTSPSSSSHGRFSAVHLAEATVAQFGGGQGGGRRKLRKRRVRRRARGAGAGRRVPCEPALEDDCVGIARAEQGSRCSLGVGVGVAPPTRHHHARVSLEPDRRGGPLDQGVDRQQRDAERAARARARKRNGRSHIQQDVTRMPANLVEQLSRQAGRQGSRRPAAAAQQTPRPRRRLRVAAHVATRSHLLGNAQLDDARQPGTQGRLAGRGAASRRGQRTEPHQGGAHRLPAAVEKRAAGRRGGQPHEGASHRRAVGCGGELGAAEWRRAASARSGAGGERRAHYF
eukprot:scaffold16371_cov95-Isochrysis_galbana.AAC.2